MQTKRVLAGILTSTLLLGTYPFASAADYNDSSVTGAAGWQAWTEAWNTIATDYTQVSMTPGADETQLNFAWYSKDETGKSARYFPATAAMVTAPDCGHMMYGSITQMDYGKTDYTTYAAKRVAKLVVDQDKDTRKLRLGCRPLAAPKTYCPYIYAADVVG